jgi:feruloyl esterase
VTPGYNLPKAAIAQVWDAQSFATVARAKTAQGLPDLETSVTAAEMALVAQPSRSRRSF